MNKPTILTSSLLIALLFTAFSFSSCTIQGDTLPDIDPDICSEQIPIVFAHGFLASGDTYAKQVQRFMANGICKERMFTFDWNSLGTQNNTSRLNTFINNLLEETGAPYVYLAGHSAGGGLGYDLLSYIEPSQNVAKYVHLGSFPNSGPAGPTGNIPTLNIYSAADAVSSGADIPGAENLDLIDKDHYEAATSLETFVAMYEFFYDEAPSVIDLSDNSETYTISGKALSFGENIPSQGASIKIYELDPNTGFRLSETPDFNLTARQFGFWGPVEVKADTYYEFFVTTGLPGSRPVHYYREPFRFDNPLVYLRSYPSSFSLAGVFLNGLPSDDNQAVTAFFGASQAAVSGRDFLTLNGVELSTPELTSADQTTIALFVYDNGDGISTNNPTSAFSALPFLNGADVFIPTDTPETITMSFNGSVINMRNWKSESEGVSVAVFE